MYEPSTVMPLATAVTSVIVEILNPAHLPSRACFHTVSAAVLSCCRLYLRCCTVTRMPRRAPSLMIRASKGVRGPYQSKVVDLPARLSIAQT